MTELVTPSSSLAVTEPVLMEVLQGARDDARERELRLLLLSFELLPYASSVDFEVAASLYRAGRAAGITPRGAVDCMIVAVAYRAGATLLSGDLDQMRIAGLAGVTVEGS